MAEYDEEEILI